MLLKNRLVLGLSCGLLVLSNHSQAAYPVQGPYDGHRYADLLNCRASLDPSDKMRSPFATRPLMVRGEKAKRPGVYVFHKFKEPEFFLAPNFPSEDQIFQLRMKYELEMATYRRELKLAGNQLIKLPEPPQSSIVYPFSVEIDGRTRKMEAVIHLGQDLIEFEPAPDMFGMRRDPVRRGRLGTPLLQPQSPVLESVGDSLGIEAQEAVVEDTRKRLRVLERELRPVLNEPSQFPMSTPRVDRKAEEQFHSRVRETIRLCEKVPALSKAIDSLRQGFENPHGKVLFKYRSSNIPKSGSSR